QTGVIGEKIQINKFVKITAPYIGSYIHAGNKIATIVGLSKTNDSLLPHSMVNISKDIAMQVAAMNPIALDESSVKSDVIEKEIEIAKDQLRAEGKPEAMLDNIAKGKLKRFFKDNTLLNQAFIKDTKISVSNYLSSFDKNLTVTSYERISIG
ncbi:MAG: translation elongation factor Ts, partial [Flavobacteriaceae bacterium]